MESSLMARFEHKVLFRITRWGALALCMLLFLALLGSCLMLVGTLSSGVERPDPTEVATSDDSTNTNPGSGDLSEAESSPLDGLEMPPNLLEQFLSANNGPILTNWLKAVERDERQSFLDDLSEAASTAKAAGKDEAQAINAYHSRYVAYVEERQVAEAATTATRLLIFSVIGSALALIALFSLVLVLMAIERNTSERGTA